MVLAACEQAPVWVTRASGEGQSVPAGSNMGLLVGYGAGSGGNSSRLLFLVLLTKYSFVCSLADAYWGSQASSVFRGRVCQSARLGKLEKTQCENEIKERTLQAQAAQTHVMRVSYVRLQLIESWILLTTQWTEKITLLSSLFLACCILRVCSGFC